MDRKLTKIIGLKKSEFDEFVKNGELQLREARLIPFSKPGDEMALTSVILSSLRLIKEFRKMILSDAKMMTGGHIHVFTEIVFSQFPDLRVDGLLIIVKGGIIKDAAIFEMKNGSNEIEQGQIENYLKIAKMSSIPKLITVSNQFVSEPTQSPVNIKAPKNVGLYHFSLTYLLTSAHILLFNNDTNIEDDSQAEIMREVVNYLEYDKSGVYGFHQMKKGWSDVVEKINSGARLKRSDSEVDDTVISWQQEEKDMALILSKNLGIFVDSGEAKFKGNLKARLDDDRKRLINDNFLISTLRVRGAVSDIKIKALFGKRIIEMSVSLKAPQDKTMRGQLGWIKRQMENCNKKNEKAFQRIKNEILIEIIIKKSSKSERVSLVDIDKIYDEIKSKEIKEFKVLFIKDFGKKFSSRNKFVAIIEEMIIDYYSGIIQFLYKWEQPAPKMMEDNKETIVTVNNENVSQDILEDSENKKETIGEIDKENTNQVAPDDSGKIAEDVQSVVSNKDTLQEQDNI
jgi:hypothetical protein|tara:strand:+ start:95 stop:1633 length:1539 start_codon:yes stop_codon:yes gene_type:complete